MLASMDLSSAQIQCLDLTNGKVKQITSDGVSEMVLSEDNLFYTIYTYKTITGSDNHSYTKENCKVHKYNTLDGTDELIFNEESDSIRIQYVDDEYIYYSSDEPYYNYRLNLTTHEKHMLILKSGLEIIHLEFINSTIRLCIIIELISIFMS